MDSSPIIQKLSHLIQNIDVLAENAVYYKLSCQHVAVSISLLKEPLDELQQYQMPWSVDELSTFNLLEFTCLKLKELLESCSGRASKSILVLRKQQVFKELSSKLQSLLKTLPWDNLSQHCKDLVHKCISSLESADFCADVDSCLVEEVEVALTEVKKGMKLSHAMLVHLADKLGLKSNQEILKEASLLEKEKNLAHLNRNKSEEELLNLLIVLVTQMSDDLAEQKHLQAQEEGINIPADFRCPLSLELMSDPVIVASGQTYERACIQQWLDQGNTTCPKSRQTLNHFTLINNFTVRALIASWCEQSGVPLPEPCKPQMPAPQTSPSQMSNVSQRSTESAIPSPSRESNIASKPAAESVRTIPRRRDAPESRRENGSEGSSSLESYGLSHGHLRVAALDQQPDRRSPLSLERENSSDGMVSLSRNSSTSSRGSSVDDTSAASITERNLSLPNIYSLHSSGDVSGELNRLTLSSSSLSSLSGDYGMRSVDGEHGFVLMGQHTGHAGLEVSPNVQSDASPEEDGDDIQFKVRGLVQNLQSTSQDVQRNAATELRLLAKFNVENRIIIADSGAIPPLISLLNSMDPQIQENAVTALLNLSINNNNKSEIAGANAIGPLVHVLNVGTSEARENAAATLFSLSVMDENKMTIGQSGAIAPLVDLLKNGTPRGKKDAATALFNLSILHENKVRIVRAMSVQPLVRLMSDPAAGMVDKAVAVIANLATIQEGRVSIGEEGGIPVLVEVVEMGSQRGKENAAAALLHICQHSNRYRSRVLQEGVIPPLVALTRSGTARAKEKASALLRQFREQRHGRGSDTHGDRRR